MTGAALPPRFDPGPIEARWQAEWEAKGYFRAPARPGARRFSLVLPPPNVTGVLTIGHMMGDTVMDVLARWHRMRGEAVLWVPGLDHAGLATQVAVRRRLAQQGIALESLPKEEVLRQVQRWKEDHEATIRAQTRAGGFSVDWSRFRYTMDAGSVRATREVFVRLYNDGLIYRGERIVNWDPKLRTAISDLEVIHHDEPAELVYLEYPWDDGAPGGLVVATVRPETIFGDVAVAVHPDDERHRAAVGRSVRVPLTGRAIPVITDPAIDPAFGNGALKVTPRHDPVDFDVARRHSELPIPASIFDEEARLVGDRVPEAFRGMDRDEARAAVTRALEETGALKRREPYVHSVGRSERSEAVIEPTLSTQWFVRIGALTGPPVEAVRSGEIRIHPERWNLTFFRWMERLEDWCISRQIAWGHPIPVYYCPSCEAEQASVEVPAACPECGATGLTQDPDVLDTWFTSWLWPFAALGWPERTGELEGYYPTSVLVTGRDIMFFWVARMMMAGYRFTGQPPFTDVVFTGVLRDDLGRKLSKHLGNSPDPLEVIRARGADTLRFALLHPNPVDQDGAFGAPTLDAARNFLTKLWNVVRFASGHLGEGMEPPARPPALGADSALENRWILAAWRRTIGEVDRALSAFELTQAAGRLYQFVWHDLADWYVEAAKDALSGERGEAERRESRLVLLYVLDRTLRALHPMVPHVTEELWHALAPDSEALAIAAWPNEAEASADPAAEAAMATVIETVRALRNLRSEAQVPAAEVPEAFVRPASPEVVEVLRTHSHLVQRLARVARVGLLEAETAPHGRMASGVTAVGEFYVALAEPTGEASEALGRERERLEALLSKTRARLSDDGFRARAPAHVVAEAEEKAKELAERLRKIDAHLAPGSSEAR
jgi:valyl-tRNA synthetase